MHAVLTEISSIAAKSSDKLKETFQHRGIAVVIVGRVRSIYTVGKTQPIFHVESNVWKIDD